MGFGAYHAGVEIYGVEWSYGYQEGETVAGETGIFQSPPK